MLQIQTCKGRNRMYIGRRCFMRIRYLMRKSFAVDLGRFKIIQGQRSKVTIASAWVVSYSTSIDLITVPVNVY